MKQQNSLFVQSPSLTAKILISPGVTLYHQQIISFSLTKDIYLPYSSLKAKFLLQNNQHINTGAAVVDFYLNDSLVHSGVIDQISITNESNQTVVSIASRSHGMTLLESSIKPGEYTNMSLNSLITLCNNSNLLCENNALAAPLVTVNERGDIWDACCKLCFQLYGSLPFNILNGEIRFTHPSTPRHFDINQLDSRVVSTQTSWDYSNLISSVKMKDANSSYNSVNFSRSDYTVAAMGIRKNKLVPYDPLWLNNLQTGLQFIIDKQKQGVQKRTVSYLGFNFEDLMDTFSVDNNPSFQNLTVNGVSLTSSLSAPLQTSIWAYIDPFLNSEAP